LDQAVAALSKADRTAILLRFYGKLPLREVGEKLGISDDAAKKRVSRALDRMLAAVAAARRGSPSATERLRAVFTAHLQTLLDEIEGATAHLQIDSLPPKLRDAIVKKRDSYERGLRRLIADGIKSGELVDMEPAVVARAMLGAMNWTVTWFRPDGRDTAAAVGEVISRFLVRGIAARTPAVTRTLMAVENR